jgi:phosphomannomutase
MIGVSGVRGIVGEGLTPQVILRYASAFAAFLGPGPVVVGRDSRPSGNVLRHAVYTGILGAGRDVLDLGIVPTPTVQLEVERQHAAGGIALTASHNPEQWNALKFVGPAGRFLTPDEARAFLATVDAAVPPVPRGAATALGIDADETAMPNLGELHHILDAVRHHVDLILELPEVNVKAVAKARPRVILDAVHGAGGAIGRELLERLGCDVTILFEEPTGHFPHVPEPRAENLTRLAEEVKKQGADIGLAFDPDVDRLSLVDENGVAIGEESTLALAADHLLSVKPGPVVSNLSTSLRTQAVAERHGQILIRTPVGEAHVVQGILDANARLGGEGNGGVILPGLHLGRDAPAGAAVILSGLVEREGSLARWNGGLPRLSMLKVQAELRGDPDWVRVRSALSGILTGVEDLRDGFRLAGDGEWVHLRKSGTEPILRIIAEAASPGRAQELVDAVRGALG